MTKPKTRFAPTPSGYLHLGNVYNALACQKWAKENNAKLVLRIDDIDQARFRIEYLEDIFENVPNEIVIHLCANKVDLPSDQWAVSRQEWMEFASNHRLLNVYETSAAPAASAAPLPCSLQAPHLWSC